ncbi:hypothetical protein [Hymenobacter elongatus]|uniref:Uncharacterized protein n=1 Tax=Hymenobacter elongatus TaxID=877208 RepID=A0A4Z0PHP5_9BACT|nr:hypothetical protein [Hymenobacter elongatus]TGE14748.1 hypothetical protein E5J99_14715 [Hymenobacter elongatus]
MKYWFLLVAGGALLFLPGCDYDDDRLTIKNRGSSSICVETAQDTVPDHPALNQPEYYLSNTIQPGASVRQTQIGSNGWPFAVDRSKDKRLNLFIYTADSVRAYHNMNSLNEKRVYRQLSFSLEQLEASNWTIVVK